MQNNNLPDQARGVVQVQPSKATTPLGQPEQRPEPMTTVASEE
jgi:hypothetical protein